MILFFFEYSFFFEQNTLRSISSFGENPFEYLFVCFVYFVLRISIDQSINQPDYNLIGD